MLIWKKIKPEDLAWPSRVNEEEYKIHNNYFIIMDEELKNLLENLRQLKTVEEKRRTELNKTGTRS